MRKCIFSLALLLTGSISFAQTKIVLDVDVSKHKEYVMETYRVDEERADAYEKILASLNQENERLKEKKISADQFNTEQKKLYMKYGTIINQAFYEGKYRTWSYCTQEVEHYHLLSDYRLVPAAKMRTLYATERDWNKERSELWKGPDEEKVKYEKEKVMIDNLENLICQILGEEDGNWYLIYKKLKTRALINMDKFKISYKDGMAIAELEVWNQQKRNEIMKKGNNYNDIEIALIEHDEELEKKVTEAVPSVAPRWLNIKHAKLEHDMNTRFGLNQVQIKEFKKAYGKYAIDEYKIMCKRDISSADKYSQVCQLSDRFCESVNHLFQPNNFVKWSGWWKFDLERKLKRKGLR